MGILMAGVIIANLMIKVEANENSFNIYRNLLGKEALIFKNLIFFNI